MRRYLSVLYHAAGETLTDRQGRAWPDLTDDEAQAWIGALYEGAPEMPVPRARELLMGRRADPLELAGRPLVKAARRRTCRVSGKESMAYRILSALYGFTPEARDE